MSFKDILVIIDTSRNGRASIETAVELAERHEAHLVGLFVRTIPFTPNFVMNQLGPEVVEVQQRWVLEAAAQGREMFESVTRGTRVSAEWREADGALLEQSLLHARYADLVVAGQYEPDSDMSTDRRDLVDHLVLESGRPALIVPYTGRPRTSGQRVLVGWNGTREAARAINDALPILQQAQRVDVLAVNPHEGAGRDGHGEIPAADICLHLARHGAKAEARYIRANDIDVGSLFLSQAADLQSDMIVMGAYGRSRFRELMLGGATRHILGSMTVPVLMSH